MNNYNQPFDYEEIILFVTGLLYGGGDFSRTMEIATRCGQDSDCYPASAGGILGALLGYSHIPEEYMPNLKEVEDMDFAYTSISFARNRKQYDMKNHSHACRSVP